MLPNHHYLSQDFDNHSYVKSNILGGECFGNISLSVHKDNDNFPRKIKSSNNQTNKPKLVGQFTKEGDLIKLWDSARKATQETKINNIHKCCQGRCNTAGGYIWKYVDES